MSRKASSSSNASSSSSSSPSSSIATSREGYQAGWWRARARRATRASDDVGRASSSRTESTSNALALANARVRRWNGGEMSEIQGGETSKGGERERMMGKRRARARAREASLSTRVNERLRDKARGRKVLPPQVEAVRRLASGVWATICVRTALAPLERVKIEYLLNRSALTPRALVRNIFAKEGLGGFWKGNLLNLARTAPYKAINFCAFDTYRGFVVKTFPEGSDGRKIGTLCAGAGAGITAVLTCFPMDVLRTRLLTTGGKAKYGGLIQCVKTMYAQEGLSTFYRGITPALVSMAPNAAVYYTIYDGLKLRRIAQLNVEMQAKIAASTDPRARAKLESDYPMKTVEASNMMLFGALAGVVSEASTYPFEVIRRRMQMQGGRSSASMVFGRKAIRRMTVTLLSIVRKQGVRGLYAGLGPSCIQVLPSASLGFFSYEMFKLLFQVD